MIWEVFARKAYEDPLHHVGTVTEDDEDLALVSARSIYDEQPWIHMIIVPRSADPGGDQAMTRTDRDGRSSARWPTTRPRWAAATPSGPCRAPTLESAVAAAAMAQDELGHARSTYPVLKALGVETPTRTASAATSGSRCSTTSCPTGTRSSPPTCSSTAC